MIFSKLDPAQLSSNRYEAQDPEVLAVVQEIIATLAQDPSALRSYAETLDGLKPQDPLVQTRSQLAADLEGLEPDTRACLERTAHRIETFARAQKACLQDLDLAVAGGRAGHRFIPHKVAGCYAPGGRFSLPSSVLMTVIPAKVAGVQCVWVSSPNPSPLLRATAYLAGADALLAAGGAQAIAALATGIDPVPACDIIVGPGNRYVTAAKHLVQDRTRIDMLAGPSELVIVADHSADPKLVAADLIAQAEHDPHAWPVLITTSPTLIPAVQSALQTQMQGLPTRANATAALGNGGYVLAQDLTQALAYCDRLAAEHVELLVQDPEAAAQKLSQYGGLFVGPDSAEVLGDYGAGPNHVLPTGGHGRFRAGLSVLDFLVPRTFLQLDRGSPDYEQVATDCAKLADLEGLCGHAAAARARLSSPT